eukprot:Hpha_TRINITY_DN16659_c1_g5::TRINITY_DN16659_c1_g5_i1::g.183771::m.183771
MPSSPRQAKCRFPPCPPGPVRSDREQWGSFRCAASVSDLPIELARISASWLDTFDLHAFSRACRSYRQLCMNDPNLLNIMAGAFPLFFAFRAEGTPGSAKLALHPAGLFRRYAEARAALEPLPIGGQWCQSTWTASSETDTDAPGALPMRRTCGVLPVFLDRGNQSEITRARGLVDSGLDVPRWAYPTRAYLAYVLEKAQLPSLDTLAWRVQVLVNAKCLASSHAKALAALPPVAEWAEEGWRSAVEQEDFGGFCDVEREVGVVQLMPGRAYAGKGNTDDSAIDWTDSGLPQGETLHDHPHAP